MSFSTSPYLEQTLRWPRRGRVLLAQYDDESVIVYQAYRPSLGHWAAEHGYLGGDFSLNRMSWIKPGFMWMMYRSGWGTKPNQEVVLSIRIDRTAFDTILNSAVLSSYDPQLYATPEEWRADVARSDVRLQWDPDHGPTGGKRARRVIQLGLRREMIRRYAQDWILEITDISDFVSEQRTHVLARDLDQLHTPTESVYPVADEAVAFRLRLFSPAA